MPKIEGSGTARLARRKEVMSKKGLIMGVILGALSWTVIAALVIAIVDCNQEDSFPRIVVVETGWAPLGVQLDGAARMGCWDYNEDQTAGTMRVMCVRDGFSIPCASALKAAPLRITIGCE
jgi:hypothetical protein